MPDKNIFILWFQGFDNAPDIVGKCLDSWKKHNKCWNIVTIDNQNISKYITITDYITFSETIQLCPKADVIRLILLNKYGGVWADATTFCTKPLDEWLPNHSQAGFFVFRGCNMVCNWFIYSKKGNYICKMWSKVSIDYYTANKKAETYYIQHKLFQGLYNTDSFFKKLFDTVPNVIGAKPQIFHNKLNDIFDYSIKKEIDDRITPLYKLSRKYKLNYSHTSIFHYLFSKYVHE